MMGLQLLIIMIVVSFGLISTSYLGDDNEIEQLSEQIIKHRTGLDVDLSPEEEHENNNSN